MTEVRTAPSMVSEVALDRGGRSAWGAIFAGTVVGLAVFLLLTLLGVGLGLTAIEVDARNPLGSVPTASGFWLFVSQIVSLGVGGYVAGRLAGVLHKIGTVLHGAAVWGVATLAAAWLTVGAGIGLFNMAGSVLTTAGTVLGTTASGVSGAIETVVPDDINLPEIAIDQIGLEDLPEPVASRLRANGITPENFRAELREAFRNVISRAEQARVRRAVMATAMDILRNPLEADKELAQLADTLFGGEDAIFSEEDRNEALRVIERRLGLTRQEAMALVERIEARYAEIRADAERALEQARAEFERAQAEAVQMADAAVDAAASAALWAAFASLLGLIAAAFGALAGRPTDLE